MVKNGVFESLCDFRMCFESSFVFCGLVGRPSGWSRLEVAQTIGLPSFGSVAGHKRGAFDRSNSFGGEINPAGWPFPAAKHLRTDGNNLTAHREKNSGDLSWTDHDEVSC